MKKGEFPIATSSSVELIDITQQVQQLVRESGIKDGVCYLFNPHTTAGITINEGADPDVQDDISGVFRQIIPRDYPYRHREGNSPSHMMTTLTGSSEVVFIEQGKIQLGTWQRIFFCEYDGPRNRRLWWKIIAG